MEASVSERNAENPGIRRLGFNQPDPLFYGGFRAQYEKRGVETLSEKPKGKLTYCLSCKNDTETIILPANSFFGYLMRDKRRICRTCAKPKQASKLEVEE